MPKPAKRPPPAKPASAKPASAKRRPSRPRAEAGDAFCSAVEAALARGDINTVSDAALRRVLTAAIKLYAAKAENAEHEPAPFDKNAITATEAVVTVCAMIRGVDLNLFDVAMWFRRPLSNAIEDLERRG